ncbi:RNA polymerase sigma factor [Ilumatobacter sp.]|uniref:RNA polymerase sigma factor n=1 Tax=Ilumatobacter sp. TaxID=1967498 RepID=UPI003B527E5B
MDDALDEDALRALVERARQHSSDAWEQLYRRYRPRLISYADRRLDSAHSAEDAVSEAFSRAVAGIDGFTWQGIGFVGWMYGITRNVVLESNRSAARDRALEERETSAARTDGRLATDDADHDLQREHERGVLRRVFDELDEADREILELRVVGELSATEVGAILDKRPGAVRMAQSRALERLRIAMREAQDA